MGWFCNNIKENRYTHRIEAPSCVYECAWLEYIVYRARHTVISISSENYSKILCVPHFFFIIKYFVLVDVVVDVC